MGILDRIAGKVDELVAGDGEGQEFEPRPNPDVELGRLLAERGNLDDAASVFGRAVDGDPGNVEGWLGLADTLARLDRFEPARDAFRHALRLPMSPERRPYAHGGLGRLYVQAGQTAKGIRELRKAAAALPDDVPILTALGRALVSAGEPEGSEWLARAGRLPGGPATLLVEAAAATRDAAKAQRLLREATERLPGDATVRAALARRLAAADQVGAGLIEARAASDAAPDNPAVWAALREVQAAAGKYREAIESAAREAACGGAPPFAVWLELALGAEDRSAIEVALQRGTAGDGGFAEARSLVDGTITKAGIAALARLAPTAEARRFIVKAVAPPPVPGGNIYAMLAWAERLAARQHELLSLAVPMARAVEAYDRPLLVAVMGEFNAGKSSFVNALVGEAIAAVGVTPTTATINVLRYGAGGGRAVYHDGTARDLSAEALPKFLGELDDEGAAAIRQVEIFAPLEALRRVEIVDTPGLNSLREAHEKVARGFLVDADAIVWVFSAGQAAKATEREALALAHAAGKRVLGVLNKVDRATPEEVAQVVRHVSAELGELIERVVPLSARAALAARVRSDGAAVAASGLPTVEEALESGFFARARELKRASALLALGRFVEDARTLVSPAAGTAEPAMAGLVALQDLPDASAVDVTEQQLRSTMARERVALRGRLDAAFRAAALEVREFVRPRGWLFGEHSADPEDESFLRELLEDGALAATAKTRAALVMALEAPSTSPAPPSTSTATLVAAIDNAIERFQAYARGIIEGAAAVFFRVDLPRIRLDLPAIYNALGRWSPDPEEALFRPLQEAIDSHILAARAEVRDRQRAAEIANLVRTEHVLAPLDALAGELARLAEAPGA